MDTEDDAVIVLDLRDESRSFSDRRADYNTRCLAVQTLKGADRLKSTFSPPTTDA